MKLDLINREHSFICCSFYLFHPSFFSNFLSLVANK